MALLEKNCWLLISHNWPLCDISQHCAYNSFIIKLCILFVACYISCVMIVMFLTVISFCSIALMNSLSESVMLLRLNTFCAIDVTISIFCSSLIAMLFMLLRCTSIFVLIRWVKLLLIVANVLHACTKIKIEQVHIVLQHIPVSQYCWTCELCPCTPQQPIP